MNYGDGNKLFINNTLMISSRKRFKRDIEEVSDQESIETYKKLANEIDICTFTYKKIQKPKNKNSI